MQSPPYSVQNVLYTSQTDLFNDKSIFHKQQKGRIVSAVSQNTRCSTKIRPTTATGSKSQVSFDIKPLHLNLKYPGKELRREELLQNRFYDKYIKESLLKTHHDQILSTLQMTSQNIINNLNLNHNAVDQINVLIVIDYKNQKESQTLLKGDPALAYSLYEALFQLDSSVLQKLYNPKSIGYNIKYDKIGQPIPDENKRGFKVEYIKQTVEILNDPMAQLIRKAGNINIELACFIEGIWKYIVVILDSISQWASDRVKTLVEDQVGQFRGQLKELEQQNNSLQEQMIIKMKGSSLRLAIEQKKYHALMDKYQHLEQEFQQQKQLHNEMGSLQNADGHMKLIGSRIREMQDTIKLVEKSHQERRNDLDQQLTKLAETFVKHQKETLPIYINIHNKLGLNTLYDSEIRLLLEAHPFCMSYMVQNISKKILNKEKVDPKYLLMSFLDYLKTNDLVGCHTPSQMFLTQVGIPKLQSVLAWFDQMDNQENKDHLFRLFSMLFGVKGELSTHPYTLRQLVEISRQVKIFGSDQEDGKQIVGLDCRLEFKRDNIYHMKIMQSWFNESIWLGVEKRLQNEDVTTMGELLVLSLEQLRDHENIQWQEFISRCCSGIKELGLGGQWVANKLPTQTSIDYLDENTVQQYVIYRYSLQFSDKFRDDQVQQQYKTKQDSQVEDEFSKFLTSTFQIIRYIWLNNPNIFLKSDWFMQAAPIPLATTESNPTPNDNNRRQSITKQRRGTLTLTQKAQPIYRQSTTTLFSIKGDDMIQPFNKKK